MVNREECGFRVRGSTKSDVTADGQPVGGRQITIYCIEYKGSTDNCLPNFNTILASNV